jgi:hypothetical protein
MQLRLLCGNLMRMLPPVPSRIVVAVVEFSAYDTDSSARWNVWLQISQAEVNTETELVLQALNLEASDRTPVSSTT